MNSTKLKDIYNNAKNAELSDIAAESLAYFAKYNERYLSQDSEEISTEGTDEFNSYFKETFIPMLADIKANNATESFEDIKEKFDVCYENVLSAETELIADEDIIAINNAYINPKNGLYIEAYEFIADDEDEYNDYVSRITSSIGDTGDFIPTVEATGINTYSVRYLYPYGRFTEEMVGIENIEDFLDTNAYTGMITSVEDVQDVTIKDVDGINVQPMMECTAEEILDYVANTTSKSLYGQMKDVYDKYGEESVQFEQATNLYKKIAKIGVESVVTSMCVCSALGIPYKSSKIIYNEMFDD